MERSILAVPPPTHPSIGSMVKAGHRRALLIGINYYGSNNRLNGCIDDIEDMEHHLRTCGYSTFTILKDSLTDLSHKNPDAPTKSNIISAMKRMVSITKPGDTLFVHYSGHGSHLSDTNGDENDNKDECICPVNYNGDSEDSGFIRDDLLNDILVKSFPEGAKLRVVFDSCHSGSALDLPVIYTTNGIEKENSNVENKDVVFISGCEDGQTSADASFHGRASGALTYALLTALGDMKTSGKHSGTWSWKDLTDMIRITLRKGRYEQISQLSVMKEGDIKKYVDIL